MDFKTVGNQIEDAANDIGAEIKEDAKSLFATVTSAISSFLGLTNPKWKQFVADWRVWTWAKRVAFLIVVSLFGFATYWWGSGTINLIGGNYSAARAYAHGVVVSKADVAQVQSTGERALRQVASKQTASVDDLKRKVDALSEKFDGLSDSIQQLQIEVSALEAARAGKPAAKVTTGSISPKPGSQTKSKAPAKPSVWDQMKAVLP